VADNGEVYDLGAENILLIGIHWNSEKILRSHWNQAVVDTANAISRGGGGVFVSIVENGSQDGTKAALIQLREKLDERNIPNLITMSETTHLDEISKLPDEESEDWIMTPRGKLARRRIPYLAASRNLALQPLYNSSITTIPFDKIVFLNDVVFNALDVANLLATRDGDYAAACSLDFDKPPHFYDTFAFRDAETGNKLIKTWPFFRARESRQALKAGRAVPMTSCWNGIVAMDAAPFYPDEDNTALMFRGLPLGLAKAHVEASECCLIHADNPLTEDKGVWLNSAVRVGYSGAAYDVVNPRKGALWISSWAVVRGAWKNRFVRWTSTQWFRDRVVKKRLAAWSRQAPKTNFEPGAYCVIDDMQVLTEEGWEAV
jgi:glycosyltransferase involved in cell wall biosynthesis